MKQRLKNLTKRIASPVLDATGVLDRRLNKLLGQPGRMLVVMYHRVITDPALDPFGLGMCVEQKHFESQLKWLRNRFEVLPLAEAVQRVRQGEKLPPYSVAITFDDGYLDNLTLAAPLLNKYELPATFFVATGGLAEGAAFWWDRVIAALADTRVESVMLPSLGFSAPLSLSPLRRLATVEQILAGLWSLPPAALPDAINEVISALTPGACYDSAAQARAARMTPEQVNQLQAMGFEIGAHTIRHVDMRSLSMKEATRELVESRQHLQEIVAEPVKAFAYPSGYHSSALHDAVRFASFSYAVSADRAINTADLRTHAIYRVGMPNAPVADLKRALCTVPIGEGASGATAIDGAQPGLAG